jgi:anaerobic magnesium-protoporphyrin IX monomethyl ester cyclase
MKILLCALPFPDLGDPASSAHSRACPNLAIYLLAAVAEDAGHQVRVVDPLEFEAAFDPERGLRETISNVDVLGISINSCTWPRARRLLFDLENLKTRPVTVLGGPHPSLFDEHILAISPADYVVRGEGEAALTTLLDRLSRGLDTEGVPGLSFRQGAAVQRNPMPPLLTPEELGALPLPRLDLMPSGYYELLPIETSRGCHHSCIFCSVTYRRNWRGMAAQTARDRIERMSAHLDRSARRSFFIIDDCFTADRGRLQGISTLLAGFPHRLVFECRIPDVIAPGIMDAISALPVLVMEMGVECGYQEGLDRVQKKLRLEEVRQAAAVISERGMGSRARFSFIMGLPWETKKEIFKTLEFAFKLAGGIGARLAANWLTLFPGSAIWRRKKEWGIEMEEADYDCNGWWADPEVFRKCHPRLDLKKDVRDVKLYALMLARLFPAIRHEWWIKDLLPPPADG